MKPLFIALCCLLLLGCGVTKTGDIADLSLHTGSKGITAKFLEQSPPTLTFQNSPVSMTLDLANEGAAPVDEGVISINTEQDLVSVQGDRVRIFRLDGRRAANPEGDRTLETVQLHTRTLPPQTEIITTSLGATFCYPYQTHAELTTCVDTDVFQRVKTKVCTAKVMGLGGGQGGPVSVTRVEPSYTPAEDAARIRAEYLITIRNLGSGQAYLQDRSQEACTPQINEEGAGLNQITMSAMLGDVPLTCTPAALRLVNGEVTVRCAVPGDIAKSDGTYTTTLTVDIDYGYSFTVTKQMQIKR